MEFWNSQLTEKSWKTLQDLTKKYKFVLIGGWAVYLWTKQQKSKDIDIVVDIPELQKLKEEALSKNDNLKNYEIKIGEIDIDIYVSYFSKLTIPPNEIKEHASRIEGFTVALKEALLILKQGAEMERRNSVKGEKDRLDIVSLLFFSDIEFSEYREILKKHSLNNLIGELIFVLRDFKEHSSLNLTPKEFRIKKEHLLKSLRKL